MGDLLRVVITVNFNYNNYVVSVTEGTHDGWS